MSNVGSIDRGLRLLAAVLLAAASFVLPLEAWGWARYAPAIIGLVLAVTAFTSFCPIYAVFGLRTCPRKNA